MKRDESKSIVAVVLGAALLTGCASLPGADLTQPETVCFWPKAD